MAEGCRTVTVCRHAETKARDKINEKRKEEGVAV
jgi:hypothetical protein